MKLYKLTVVDPDVSSNIIEERYYYSKTRAENDKTYLILKTYKYQNVDISILPINTEDEVQ